jgi:hypothetical protein
VRGQYDEAVDVLSDQALACLNVDDDPDKEALDARGAREHLREIMEYSAKEMGDRDHLTEAVDAVKRWVHLSGKMVSGKTSVIGAVIAISMSNSAPIKR